MYLKVLILVIALESSEVLSLVKNKNIPKWKKQVRISPENLPFHLLFILEMLKIHYFLFVPLTLSSICINLKAKSSFFIMQRRMLTNCLCQKIMRVDYF